MEITDQTSGLNEIVEYGLLKPGRTILNVFLKDDQTYTYLPYNREAEGKRIRCALRPHSFMDHGIQTELRY